MDTKIMKALYSVLSQFEEKYFISGDLNKSKVIEDIDKYDENLVLALLNDPLVRKHYSKNLGEYTIIETNKLIETFEMDDFWMDSHTKYTKKIGLTSRGRFIDESTEVVLDFPYKDTVLKAGMTKEDVEKDDLKPDEPFYNEVIASEEIDVMLDKKILVNAKRYSNDGVEAASDFDGEEDNLILKGNNLLVLHALREKFAGKVQLIYIDPPYNTDSGSFQYNDKFSHSTWLTFMKNRLEVAKELLKPNGVLFVQCDDNEQAYLKVLLDDIFGRGSFVATIHCQMSTTQGMKVRSAQLGNVVKNGEYIHVFTPDGHKNIAIHPLYDIREDYDEHYSLYLKDDENIVPLRELYDYRYPKDLNNEKPISLKEAFQKSAEFAEIVRSHLAEIVRSHLAEIVRSDKVTGEDISDELQEGKYKKVIRGDKEYLLTINSKGRMQQLLRLSDSWGKTDSYKSPEGLRKIRGDWWEDYYLDMGNVNKEGNVVFSNGKKPERLLKDIISMTTNPGDLVLDFHLGTGTTAAVAHKLSRKYIGIEQMDYIKTLSVPRLQKVIEGEQGGISKDVDWQGGGSFVYAELMEKSQGYIDQIYKADDSEELFKIYHLMLENVDLNFKVDLQALEEILEEESSLDERKKLLLKVIDKNQLYYNYSEIDDVNVRDLISDTDYAFNQSFYKEDDVIG
ncbi:type III restriction endonuclease subunit M [Falseniella ignava]|uniref:Type III restriction endonuclease subunit M n=1 Tax=Falseniella ignava TaxID=137730 RepID=A0A2I1K4U2_9LACT|nr:site-specific DNA-methyltransferase [Falseniella ignava]PKY90582.1 type III restriction endonuclease subunit M [Falseniella ignava]